MEDKNNVDINKELIDNIKALKNTDDFKKKSKLAKAI